MTNNNINNNSIIKIDDIYRDWHVLGDIEDDVMTDGIAYEYVYVRTYEIDRMDIFDGDAIQIVVCGEGYEFSDYLQDNAPGNYSYDQVDNIYYESEYDDPTGYAFVVRDVRPATVGDVRRAENFN